MVDARRYRKVEVVAQDPSVRRGSKVVTSVVTIPYEPLDPGPMGYALHVVDYDASTASFYEPAVLPDEDIIVAPSTRTALLNDPVYHAINVYALVMRTLARFEFALGRRVGWGVRGHQLKVVPHAFEEANAFYSPEAEAILFGYTRSSPPMFLCLSHDIVVHETAHALLDGLRGRFMAPSSADQAALHEAFADIVALLSVFSLGDILGYFLDSTLARADRRATPAGMIARRHLTETALRRTVLLGMAEEMHDPDDLTRANALRRSVELMARPAILEEHEFLDEPHRRGEVVVAAFMSAFVKVWVGRLERLGSPGGRHVDRELAAEQGAIIADRLMTMAIRAIDYTPPIHISFGDFLSALVTADSEVRADDGTYELRRHLLEAFGEFGITPVARGDDAVRGRWERPDRPLDRSGVHLVALQTDPTEMFRLVWRNRAALGLHDNAFTRIASVRPCVRVSPDDGAQLRETVVEVTQYVKITVAQLPDFGLRRPPGMAAELEEEFALEGGATLILDEFGDLKFSISNHLPSRHDRAERRARSQARLDYLWANGYLTGHANLSNGLGQLHALRARGDEFGVADRYDASQAWV